jgi:hypothetical protein
VHRGGLASHVAHRHPVEAEDRHRPEQADQRRREDVVAERGLAEAAGDEREEQQRAELREHLCGGGEPGVTGDPVRRRAADCAVGGHL